jgi:hypothetical protein
MGNTPVKSPSQKLRQALVEYDRAGVAELLSSGAVSKADLEENHFLELVNRNWEDPTVGALCRLGSDANRLTYVAAALTKQSSYGVAPTLKLMDDRAAAGRYLQHLFPAAVMTGDAAAVEAMVAASAFDATQGLGLRMLTKAAVQKRDLVPAVALMVPAMKLTDSRDWSELSSMAAGNGDLAKVFAGK